MSRSRKRPFKQVATQKFMKKVYNRQIRRSQEDVGCNMEYKKHHESYEICDWIFYEPDKPEFYRK